MKRRQVVRSLTAASLFPLSRPKQLAPFGAPPPKFWFGDAVKLSFESDGKIITYRGRVAGVIWCDPKWNWAYHESGWSYYILWLKCPGSENFENYIDDYTTHESELSYDE